MDKELENNTNNNLVKVPGLYAKIKSGYYLRNDQKSEKIYYYDEEQAYQHLKQYIEENKSESDIIVYDETEKEIIISTVDKNLKLDRFVYIDESKINMPIL